MSSFSKVRCYAVPYCYSSWILVNKEDMCLIAEARRPWSSLRGSSVVMPQDYYNADPSSVVDINVYSPDWEVIWFPTPTCIEDLRDSHKSVESREVCRCFVGGRSDGVF